jgi:hypothetical protein
MKSDDFSCESGSEAAFLPNAVQMGAPVGPVIVFQNAKLRQDFALQVRGLLERELAGLVGGGEVVLPFDAIGQGFASSAQTGWAASAVQAANAASETATPRYLDDVHATGSNR